MSNKDYFHILVCILFLRNNRLLNNRRKIKPFSLFVSILFIPSFLVMIIITIIFLISDLLLCVRRHAQYSIWLLITNHVISINHTHLHVFIVFHFIVFYHYFLLHAMSENTLYVCVATKHCLLLIEILYYHFFCKTSLELFFYNFVQNTIWHKIVNVSLTCIFISSYQRNTF